MNDYDDSEDYSSANSFRARSNTWPLNRPDLAVPSGVCIDETLPEIELEDDDLFTTNENWSTGLVDHDIMSWDPILNAQNHQQQQQQQQQTTDSSHLHQLQNQHLHQATQQQPYQSTAAATIHHHHHQPHEGQQQQHQRQQPPQVHHQQQQHHPQAHPHQQQQQQQQQQQPTSHHHHQHHHQPQQQQQQDLQTHDALLGGPIMVCRSQPPQQQQHAQGIQPPNQHHQTLNCSHYLDSDDPNDYHIQQLHHLHLDNNQAPSDYQSQYISTSISPMCAPGQTNLANSDSYNISSDHQSHNLQPLTSARYDLDAQCETGHNDLTGHQPDQQQQHHHQIHQHHSHPHQLHNLTSSSLDNHSGASHMLSSSLSTSGICLSGDLEDLDYKPVDPATILQSSQYGEDRLQDQSHKTSCQLLAGASDEGGNNSNKQSSSTTSSKTKLNTPRRNAWGNMSYADLISQAINSTNDKRLTLSQIYEWMVQHVPYFKDKGDSNSSAGWKNSVRHNLSLHNRFKRLQNEGTGKSSWWTINPEANVGKCARRRAASMEASKFEKKRGRAKKRAEAVRQGLLSYPSLTNSSLNGSTSTLEQQLQPQISHLQQQQQQQSTIIQLGPQAQQARLVDQFEAQRPPQSHPQQKQQLQNPQSQQPLQSQIISQFDSDKQPQQQQQQQIQQHNHHQQQQQNQQQQPPPPQPQNDGSNTDNSQNRQPNTGLYVASTLKSQYELDPRYTIVMSK